jgi:lipopolysaccharide export system permease protein
MRILTTLDRYIGITLAGSYFLVMLLLLTLFGVLDLVGELEHVGTGAYRLKDAIMFVLLTMPMRMLDLLPVTALMGTAMALAGLANTGEFIAMRAAGLSVIRVGGAILKTGVLLVVLAVVLEEFVAPPLKQYAIRMQSFAISGIRLHNERGFWSRKGLRFINVRDILVGRIPSDIDIYEFDVDSNLHIYIHAAEADISDPSEWRLRTVDMKTIGQRTITTQHLPTFKWKSFLSERELHALEFPSDSLSLSALNYYVDYLLSIGAPSIRYQYELWKKLFLPWLTGAMVLLATPIVFASPRSANKGKLLALTTVLSICLYFLNEIAINVGLFYQLSPPLVTALPVALIVTVALAQFRRVL